MNKKIIIWLVFNAMFVSSCHIVKPFFIKNNKKEIEDNHLIYRREEMIEEIHKMILAKLI